MKKLLTILSAAALVCALTSLSSYKKGKGPDGPTDFSGGCEAVDLGLSVKWAAYNVGALNVDDSCSYFAWGETEEKDNYNWTKDGGDGLKTLQAGDDPATKNWGSKWRTPTLDEIKELFDKTKCEWIWDATKKGYTIKGLKTGDSIFLPITGFRDGTDLKGIGTDGVYWSSSVFESAPTSAYFFNFNSVQHHWGYISRYYGLSVRAVTDY